MRALVILSLLAACASAPTIRSSEAATDLTAVAYRSGPSGPEGSLIPLQLRVRERPGPASVAVFEDFSSGAGEQWRASTWIAAIQAAHVLDLPLAGKEISVSVTGLIDGPSAGALMTAGLMATLRGIPTRNDVTMTGTINPDGTVGPVGGIAFKMEAAAAAGKRFFGLPAGSRMQRHPTTDQPIDLFAHGARLGLQVVELGDVYDAYTLLTGEALARPDALDVRSMMPSPRAERRMQLEIAQYERVVRQGLAEYQRQPEAMQAALRGGVQFGVQSWQESERYLRQGLVSIGHARAMRAAVFLFDVAADAELLNRVAAYDVRGLSHRARQLSGTEQAVQTYALELRAAHAWSVNDVVALSQRYSKALVANELAARARVDFRVANAMLERVDPSRMNVEQMEEAIGDIGVRLGTAATFYEAAGLVVALARQGGAFQPATGTPYDVAKLRDRAYTTTVAAKAVLDYYDSIIVAQLAQTNRVSEDVAREHLYVTDSDYRGVLESLRTAMSLREANAIGDSILMLAAAERAYVVGSFLVMRDYSLGAEKNERGDYVAVQNDLALIGALAAAEVSARRAGLAAVAAVGGVPEEASIAYDRARIQREGSVEDRLQALRNFWIASQLSRTASAIAVQR